MERIKKISRSQGFTLVELILTMVLLGIIVVVTGILMGRSLDAYKLVSTRTETVHEARFALVRLQKELEQERQVTTASPQQVVFLDPTATQIDIHLTGTTIYRGSDILAENVSNLLFTYYRDNGNTTSSAAQVRRIHIDMTVRADATSGSLQLRTDVFPRIFMYENFQ